MTDQIAAEREAMQLFKERMTQLQGELRAINKELGTQDLMQIADRTRDLLRRTKGLLDGNVNILFAGQPSHVPSDLYANVEYADNHIRKALSEDYDFDVIKQRLYMATTLCDHVIRRISGAMENLAGLP